MADLVKGNSTTNWQKSKLPMIIGKESSEQSIDSVLSQLTHLIIHITSNRCANI